MLSKMLLILEILSKANKPLTGLEIVKLSGNKVKRSSVYIYLTKLEDQNLVRREASDTIVYGDNSTCTRHVFSITYPGRGRLADLQGKTSPNTGLGFV